MYTKFATYSIYVPAVPYIAMRVYRVCTIHVMTWFVRAVDGSTEKGADEAPNYSGELLIFFKLHFICV